MAASSADGTDVPTAEMLVVLMVCYWVAERAALTDASWTVAVARP
jgi:hypothetical protein